MATDAVADLIRDALPDLSEDQAASLKSAIRMVHEEMLGEEGGEEIEEDLLSEDQPDAALAFLPSE